MRVLLDLDQRMVAGVAGNMEIRRGILSDESNVGRMGAIVHRQRPPVPAALAV
jgi:hypothetical protein